MPLLASNEPPAFSVERPRGASRAVLLCDHASHRLPRALGNLGLEPHELIDHIAWDPGAAVVARKLAELLDAPLVLSGYSRLAIDCNRPLAAPSSIPFETCGVRVPGNERLSWADRAARADELFWPYHRAIEALLAERDASGLASVILSIHSFTPSLYGRARPWHLGLVYGRDPRLARALLAALGRHQGLVLGDNEPYQVTDTGDYGVPTYGERRGRPAVLVELRQDLVREQSEAWRFAELLASAYREVETGLG